ncbi:MAG: caspase family protein [Sphingomonadaceae bacterium]
MRRPATWLRACTVLALLASASPLLAADTKTASKSASNSAAAAAERPQPDQPRATRHALIIAIGDYIDPAIPSLNGIRFDVDSARRMAGAMQVPPDNITVLRDRDATAARIEQEIAALNLRTQPGDRVFFYFSGHGSRWLDVGAQKTGCVEALLPADGAPLTNERVASLLKPISDKADKLFVFYDACHSGGIVGKPLALTRSLTRPDGAHLTPKFSPAGVADACSRPTNLRTRSLTTEAVKSGSLPQNIVQISSSRPDEVSFDDDSAGGLATQAWRDCMLGAGSDLDQSGAISVSEIAVCAQTRIDARFASSQQYAAQHLTLGGNTGFVPGWFTSAFVPAVPVAASAPPSDPGAAFNDLLAQRDPRRKVTLTAPSTLLKIGQDTLDVSVTSSHDGYLYLVLLGSDNSSYYLLFPNDRDHDNQIKAGQTIKLPRPDWRIRAQGPAGVDRMLVVVSEAERDLSLLGNRKAGPFVQSLSDANGRANLQWLLSTARQQSQPSCQPGGAKRTAANSRLCSDAYGAALVEFTER